MNYNDECTFPIVNDTTDIQLNSLFTFAAALGYDPVFPETDGPESTENALEVLYFLNPRAECVGQSRVSVNTMIRKHNVLPNQVFRQIQDGGKVGFNDLIATPTGEDQIVALFAGYTRTVRKVKLTHSKKKGIIVQSHKVSFQTRRDAAQHADQIC